MHLYRKKRDIQSGAAMLAGIFLCAVILLSAGSSHLSWTAQREQEELLQEAIRQAIVSCYAMEGRYPESLDYLIENYGLQADTEKFIITYEVFADNVRPQVRVIRLEE